MKSLLIVFFLIFFTSIQFVQGQESEMDKQLATLQEEISLLESKIENIQTITWEPYAVIAAIAGVIVAIYSVISSNRMTGKSFTNFQKTAEADLLFKLNDTIYRSDEGKKIIEGAKKG